MIENRLLKKIVLADGEDMSKSARKTDMVYVVGKAIAVADGGRFAADRARYRRLAVAAIRPLGIVRLTGRELVDRKRSRFSRGELTPFSERGSAVLLEDVAAVEVAVLVEDPMGRSRDPL